MSAIPVRFVIGQLPEEDIDDLKHDQVITSKLLLSPADFEIFNYKRGDSIEVESNDGYRQWCTILDLEIVKTPVDVILIFSLKRTCVSSGKTFELNDRN
ncbi:MAG TPA: hypothetical protein VD927_10515 [Chryseosolibacter sp.]|nr:hypothetical protein [Chryseosolibacter sp.]